MEDLVQLLRNQTSLDTLELIGASENLNLNLHPEFKVRRLSIIYERNNLDTSDFALQFVGRIESLSLDLDKIRKTDNFSRIVQNFTTIKTLRIACWVPDDANFYNTAKVNTNLAELSIVYLKFSATGLLGVFKIFPNLKRLTVAGASDDGLSPDDVKTLHNKLKQLESFTVEICSHEKWDTVAKLFRNITHLYFCSCEGQSCWPDTSRFSDSIENVKFLSIRNNGDELKFTSEDFESVLLSFPNLTTLRLSSGIFKEKFLPIFGKTTNNLKSLQLMGISLAVLGRFNKKLKGISSVIVTKVPDNGLTLNHALFFKGVTYF